MNPATNTGYAAKLDQMSQAIHRDGKYWIAPFAPGFDARLVGGKGSCPAIAARPCGPSTWSASGSSPDMLGLISWNEFSENSYVEPSRHYGYQALDLLRQLRVNAVAGRGRPPHGAVPATVLTPWPNVVRLSGFALALVAAVGFLGYARRRKSGRRSG